MNGDESGDENSLKGFYAYKNTFDEDTIWMDIPRHVTFINTTNPYLDPSTPEFDNMSVVSMDSSGPFDPRPLAAWRTHSNGHSSNAQSVTSTPSTMGIDMAPPSVPVSYTPELEAVPSLMQSPSTSMLDTPASTHATLYNRRMNGPVDRPTAATPPPIDPRLNPSYDSSFEHMPRSSPVASSRPSPHLECDLPRENDHEIAFLLRWFSEGPGHWMDLFDLGSYFASYVPVKAQENALLKYAAVACAAKALARVQGRKPTMGGSVTRQARMELFPDAPVVDWKHKAAIYYDNAVSLLLQALKQDSSPAPDVSDSELQRHNGNTAIYCVGKSPRKCRDLSNATFASSTDELLAASAILCVYEFLDTSVSEWAQHLNGAKSLLFLSKERVTMFSVSAPRSSISTIGTSFVSKARRATFWNIARQDMLAAFINKTRTRLDTEDLSLWKDAGLILDENGFIVPSNNTRSGYPEDSQSMMREDIICNALVWLMSKLVNFMAASHDLTDHSNPGVHQQTLLDYWNSLVTQFKVWHDGLPVTFRPSARLRPTDTPRQLLQGENSFSFTESWYSLPMCASTMQTYHMSQILLLLNKPNDTQRGRSTVNTHMNSYQSLLAVCQKHSREIVGISLARSDEAVRIHSVQPLFIAGQCLSDARERHVVLQLLRDVELDIGWASDYRVQQLLQHWRGESHHHESHVT